MFYCKVITSGQSLTGPASLMNIHHIHCYYTTDLYLCSCLFVLTLYTVHDKLVQYHNPKFLNIEVSKVMYATKEKAPLV